MRRRSKEPRRISVVEGRAAASLARALMTVLCFIYTNETQSTGLVNPSRNIYFKFVLHERRQRDRPDHKPGWTAKPHNPFFGTGFLKHLQSRHATESSGRQLNLS